MKAQIDRIKLAKNACTMVSRIRCIPVVNR